MASPVSVLEQKIIVADAFVMDLEEFWGRKLFHSSKVSKRFHVKANPISSSSSRRRDRRC